MRSDVPILRRRRQYSQAVLGVVVVEKNSLLMSGVVWGIGLAVHDKEALSRESFTQSFRALLIPSFFCMTT